MLHIPWKDRYNIHYKEIDAQHQSLLAILNELASIAETDRAEQQADIAHRLCQYALTHFSTEEKYMLAAGYEGLETHQAEHATFIQELLDLNQAYDSDDPRLAKATFLFVKNWYTNHIMQSDMEYVPSLKSYHARAPLHGIVFTLNALCASQEAGFIAHVAQLSGQDPHEIDQRFQSQPSLFKGYASGYLSTQEFLSGISDLCGVQVAGEAIEASYANVFQPRHEVLEIAQRLKPRYRLGLLADTTPLRFEHGIQNLDWVTHFDEVILPYAHHLTKPEQALFRLVEARMGCMSEECLFIDTDASSVIAATGARFHGLAAQGSEQLLRQLRQRKIDI